MLDLNVQNARLGGTTILEGIRLCVRHGETLALVGPSGIGKTTLLRIIAGLEDRFEGTCNVAGRVAMVFQEPTLLPWRSLRDNLCITTGISPAEAAEALSEAGLEGRGDDFPGALSLGQQRRLSLARVFAVKPHLLLMDEPFVSLDPALVQDMMAVFKRLRAAHQVTTILVTHADAEARELASRLVRLGGTPATITEDTPV